MRQKRATCADGTIYIRSAVRMWSHANDEEKSHLILDAAYVSRTLLVHGHLDMEGSALVFDNDRGVQYNTLCSANTCRGVAQLGRAHGSGP